MEFRAYRAYEEGKTTTRKVEKVGPETLPEHAVTVAVAYSSLNYKDALSATGNRGVTKTYPHTPGIDAAGRVVASSDARFGEGDEVIVTSYDLGMNTPGGFGEYIRVPADWVVRLPAGLSLREAMVLGTAGLTAAMCVDALLGQGLTDPVVVTGSSGGVGSLAVALLAKLGYHVIASTGSEGAHAMLKELGAAEILGRHELSEASERPMLKSVYGGAVDTVGGRTLQNLVKSLKGGASVAACGLVGGPDLSLTVYPFILRGVNLLGSDSQNLALSKRQALWERLAGEWRLDNLEKITTEVGLEDLDAAVDAILKGETRGRTLVRVGA